MSYLHKNMHNTLGFNKFSGLIFVALIILVIRPASAMEGGVNASSDQSKGIVAISYEGEFRNCVGVLLEPSRVLTTVSCVDLIGAQITADKIRVHPLQGDSIGGNFLLPVVNENVLPFVGVNSIVLHPNNTSSQGPYNLAVLRLSIPLTIDKATIYDGTQTFLGNSAQAFGWTEFEDNSGFLTKRFFRPSVLGLPQIVDGDSNIESISNGCYDNFQDTDTTFCAGFRNASKFLDFSDQGAPIYQQINGVSVVIGLLKSASGGFDLEGVFAYEEYARVSSMISFIKQQAPNTQFSSQIVGGVIDEPKPSAIPAVISLLLD